MFPYEAENCPFKIYEELCLNFDGVCTDSVDCFWQNGHFDCTNPTVSMGDLLIASIS